MPVDVIWDDEAHSIIRYVFDGPWGWDEFRPIIDKADAMSRTVSHRVDIIADLTNSARLPVQNAFPTLKYMAELTADNVLEGLFIVTGGGSFVAGLVQTFKRVYPNLGSTPYTASTLADAHQMIGADRSQQG
jgi:hypothetical protein